jgi:hypothetical protein
MSESLKLTGRIHMIGETQTFPSGFQKREFVVDDCAEKYNQLIKFEAMKDGCDRLDAYKVGDEVTVDFNLRGNEYNGKYYVSLQAWKITKGQAQDAMPEGRQQQRTMPKAPAPAPAQADSVDEDEGDEEDDIPF